MRLPERPSGWSPLGTAGHLHICDLLCCLPVVCVCVGGGGGGGGGGTKGSTIGSESSDTCSDEASSHKVQFFRGLVHFQW